MIKSSFGQLNADTAKYLYQSAGRAADTLVRMGKIGTADRGVAFAKLASKDLSRYGIKASKEMLIQASKELPVVDAMVARSASRAVQVAATTTSTSGAVVKSAAVSTAATVARQTAVEAAKSTARGAAPIAAAFFAVEGAYNLVRYARGDISGQEARRRTARSAASNGGGVAGAAAGAAIGSVVPVVGTAVGALVGGIVGGTLSGWLAGEAMK